MLSFRQMKKKNLVGIKCAPHGPIKKDASNVSFHKFHKTHFHTKFDTDMYSKTSLLPFEYRMEKFPSSLRVFSSKGGERTSCINICHLKLHCGF